MRKVDVARLAGKIERAAAELNHDVGRLRSAGYGPSAEALALCSRQLEEIARGLQPKHQSGPKERPNRDADITEIARLVEKGFRDG